MNLPQAGQPTLMEHSTFVSDAPALFTRHQALATHEAANWTIPGGDANDARQEARIALWEACRCYDPTLGPFKPFALLVIRRRMRDALRQAQRGKHRILTEAARDHDTPTSQQDIIERREELRSLVAAFDQLSLLERDAITAVANGEPYASLGPKKHADNAVQRARRKLRAAVA